MACAKRDARVRMACRKLEHRSNTSGQSMGFYRQSGALVAVRLPPSQMPGYAGQNPNASRDIGTSKAFGQPFVRWTIPRTPDATAGPTGRGADGWTLSDGFGPIGRETKHKFGPASAKVNAAYDESDRMLEALARQRVLNGPDTFQRNGAPWHEGKRAPFDFVPNEGLVEECHIHESGRYVQRAAPCNLAQPWPSGQRVVVLGRVSFNTTTRTRHACMRTRPNRTPLASAVDPLSGSLMLAGTNSSPSRRPRSPTRASS